MACANRTSRGVSATHWEDESCTGRCNGPTYSCPASGQISGVALGFIAQRVVFGDNDKCVR